MAVVESLYHYVLAGLNMTSGWLLYDFLDTNLGAVLLAVGVVLILAVTLESTHAHLEDISS